jgi:hypothetical protein
MEDCVLKTNDYWDLIPFINEQYHKEWYFGTIACYDAVEDVYYEAIMRACGKDVVDGPYEFWFWEEIEND